MKAFPVTFIPPGFLSRPVNRIEEAVRGFRVNQDALESNRQTFHAALSELIADILVVSPNGYFVSKIVRPENLIHHHPQMMLFVVVYRHENRAVVRQQLFVQLETRPHHAKPLVVTLEVFAVNRAVRLQPLAHQRAVDVVVVRPALVARIVRRVNVDAVDAPGVAGEKRLQRMQVVAVDNEAAVRGGGNRIHAIRTNERTGGGVIERTSTDGSERDGSAISGR